MILEHFYVFSHIRGMDLIDIRIQQILYGIFQGEKLIGIGGLNEDPYTENNKVGRSKGSCDSTIGFQTNLYICSCVC